MMRPNLANKNPRLPGASLQKPKLRKIPTHLDNHHRRHSNEFEYLLSKNALEDELYRKDSSETTIMALKRHWRRLSHFLVEDWFLSAILGLIVAVISISVDICYEYLNYFQVVLYDYALNYNKLLAFICWTSYITALVCAASLVCKYIGKAAIGSGIPQLKVIMNGFVLHNYLSMRTLVAKVIGLILTLGSGLPVGKEGPFVHIGAIVGFRLSKMTQNFQGNKQISNESREFQSLLSGCAVGVACTFTAPVGAVLYAIECTHKYFAVKHYWKSFFATTCSALVFRYANIYLTPPQIGETILAYYETHFPNEVFVAEELPVFILLGIISGLLASFFVFVHRELVNFRKTSSIYRQIFGRNYNITFTIFMAFVVGVVNWPDGIGNYLGGRFTFRQVLSDFISNCTMSEMNVTRHGCSDDIVYRWTNDEDLSISHRVFTTLFGYLFANFFLIAICISLAIPAGIFVPSFVIGACGGRIIGELMSVLFPYGIRGLSGTQIYPGLYAIVGASAFTGALTHSFSIAVIVCEATGQISGLLPMLVGLMAANAVSHFLSPSIYDSIIRLKNYPHLADLPRKHTSQIHAITVEQIMIQDCVFITCNTTYKELRDLLIATPQLKSYPLVNNSKDKILLGSVGRKYLYYMLSTQIGPDPSLLLRRASGNVSDLYSTYRRGSALNTNSIRFTDRHIMGNTLLSTSPLHEDHGSRDSPLAPLLRRQTLPEITNYSLLDRDLQLLKPIELDEAAIDAAPFQLVRGTSIYKVHSLFSLLGLNHAFVTHLGALVGIIGLREIRNIMSIIDNRIQRKNFVLHPSNPLLNNNNNETVEELINDETSDDENTVILPAVTVSKTDSHESENYDTDGDDDVFESVSLISQKTQ